MNKNNSTLGFIVRFAFIFLASTALAACAEAPVRANSSLADRMHLLQQYGSIPLSFEQNQGQSSPEVRFLSRGNGYALFLTKTGAVLSLGEKHETIQMRLSGGLTEGSSRAAQVTGEEQLAGKISYFLGNDPAKWHANLPTYAKVRYTGVYPGIDLVYYGNQRQLEYDFIVAPRADPQKIRLNFAGQKKITVAGNGDLQLVGPDGSVSFRKPVLYQLLHGKRQPVAGSFQLLAENSVSFSIGDYDRSRALIIDPVLVYSTLLGGSGWNGHGDQGNGIAVDALGYAYVVGTTYSADFPLDSNPIQGVNHAAPSSGNTVFVTKFNRIGTGLVYSTYLGGSGGDFGYGIALDSANQAYITGATYSQDFPTTCGAFQAVTRSRTVGAPTGFVTKLTADGTTIAYSTYLGGGGNHASPALGDVPQAIAVGPHGYAYVTGYAYSTNFPVTGAAFQKVKGGTASISNAFVTKLNATGTGVVYSTYLGGDGKDFGNAIAVNQNGQAFITGNTGSANFPVTSAAVQTVNHGANTAFVTELNSAGSDEVFSTYLGGSSGDFAQAISLDGEGNTYIAGSTSSADFPTTAGVLEGASYASYPFTITGMTGFVTKLNSDGTSLVYSTYLEGPGTTITGLAVDGAGSAYVSGFAGTDGVGYFGGFQETPDALKTPSNALAAFVVKLDPMATTLSFASFLGGSTSSGAMAVALDSKGNAYLTGYADGSDFKTTTGAFQRKSHATSSGESNAFVSKFALATEANQTTYPEAMTSVPTSLSIVSQDFQWGICDLVWWEDITVEIHAGLPFPAPTGYVDVYNDGGNYPSETQVDGQTGGVTDVYILADPGAAAFPQWTAYYSGDNVFLGSSISGSPDVPSCTPDSQRAFARLGTKSNGTQPWYASLTTPGKRVFHIPVKSVSASPRRIVSGMGRVVLAGAKFTPQLPLISVAGMTSGQELAILPQATPACIAPGPKPTLTVALRSAGRQYGAANPKFFYTVSGVINGDTVTVTPSTTAIASSPAGEYPITASVLGPNVSSYSLSIQPGTLTVRKAPLSLVASNQFVIYGQTPVPPSTYRFVGFLNGDTASVVSGSPVLSTSVTSTTQVGYYNVQIDPGTLTASNYYFVPYPHPGAVGVTKAPLTVKADDLSAQAGEPIPPLTYSFSGFVNTNTAGNSIIGAPVLRTTATTHSAPGKYPIYLSTGTLASHNYQITAVAGIITITQ